jgi:hypothetical protein
MGSGRKKLMDPDQILLDMRILSERIKRIVHEMKYEPGEDVDIDDSFREAADLLADKVQALDGWLKTGGFAPKSWTQKKTEPV